MSALIHPLESRLLMSASLTSVDTDAASIATDSAAVTAAFTALKSADVSFRASLVQSITALETSATQSKDNKLIAVLSRDSTANYAHIAKAESAFLTAVEAKTTVAEADAQLLGTDPTSRSLERKLLHGIAVLDGTLLKITPLEKAVMNAGKTTSVVYSRIQTAVPSLASTIESSLSNEGTLTDSFATAAIQITSDVAKLASDLA